MLVNYVKTEKNNITFLNYDINLGGCKPLDSINPNLVDNEIPCTSHVQVNHCHANNDADLYPRKKVKFEGDEEVPEKYRNDYTDVYFEGCTKKD